MVSPDGVGGRFMVGRYSEGNLAGDYTPCFTWLEDSQQ